MGSAAHSRQPGNTSNARRGTRVGAAALALVLNGAIVYLFASLGIVRPPQATEEPIVAHLILEPLRLHLDSTLPALTPQLVKPILRPADTPPDIRIEDPTADPAPRQPSDPQLSDGSPASPLVTDQPGEGAGLKILHYVAAVYSVASAKSHEHGIVKLRVLVDEQGKPSQVHVLDSSGFVRLDDSAMKAVWQYRFSRTISESRPLQVWTTVTQEFEPMPMPAPTTLIWFDSSAASQVTAAIHSKDSRRHLLSHEIFVARLADRMVQSLSSDSGRTADLRRAGLSSTPGERLATLGEVRAVQFLGFAAPDFSHEIPLSEMTPTDSNPPDQAKSVRCEIFEVRQGRGTSYWFAMIDTAGMQLRGLQISVPTEPLRAGTSRNSTSSE